MENIQKTKMTPRDFFVQFGGIVALYISIGAFLTLIFTVIDKAFPDVLNPVYYYDGYSASIRFAIASLIVIFPTYLILLRLIIKDSDKNPEKKNLSIRKWFTYLTLFLSAGFVIGDLITLLNFFLGGEVSSRFILKVLSVLIVCAGVFIYYIIDLRGQVSATKHYKIFTIASTVVVALSIILGFTIIGLPQNQRAIQLDAKHVDNLSYIQNQITQYYQQKTTVPAVLADLNDSLSSDFVPKDPETGLDYKYEKVSAVSFSLCANFATEVSSDNTTKAIYPVYQNENWQHAKGNVCFTRTIDPKRYPVIK